MRNEMSLFLEDGRCIVPPLHTPISPLDKMISDESDARIEQCLSILDPIERDVICRRYGLRRFARTTQSALARDQRCSRKRIANLERRSLMKMRYRLEEK
jgi:DNA-directed RNA polymerase sigma subunit (sigma70/sigma32)